MPLYYLTMQSPVGLLKIVANEIGICAILWENDRLSRLSFAPALDAAQIDKHNFFLLQCKEQLCEYFAKERKGFDVPIDMIGSPFQKQVWQTLLTIPYGQTRSYGEVAGEIGKHGAARAAGAAIGKNPISIIVPCHRVLGANGKLTGFAGGLNVKAKLLSLEQEML